MKNKIKILLDLYGIHYFQLTDTIVLIKALKKLPEDMQLDAKMNFTTFGPAQVVKKVSERIVELERNEKILSARVEAIKEEVNAIDGGKEALNNWVWKNEQGN